MPFRPIAEHRRNVHRVIYPLTEAIRRLYGARPSDGAYPIGAFYTVNVDNRLWLHADGVWYRPRQQGKIESRQLDNAAVEVFIASIANGAPARLPSGTLVAFELIPDFEADQLPRV